MAKEQMADIAKKAIAKDLNNFFDKKGLGQRLNFREFDKLGLNFSGKSFDEKEAVTIVYAYNKGRETGDFSDYLSMVSQKLDMSMKYDAMNNACNEAEMPVLRTGEKGFEPFTL